MFLYFAYNKNDYIQQVTYKYNNNMYQKKYINEEFIRICVDQDPNNTSSKCSHLDIQNNWDIEKGNPEEYYAYLTQKGKTLSLLIPINTNEYNMLRDKEKERYAELIEMYYEDTLKNSKHINSPNKIKENKRK